MRLFVSLPLPAPVRADLAAALAGVRTTDPARWHMTLAFLGERPGTVELERHLSALAARCRPFALRVVGGGGFGDVRWAGVGGDVDGLHRLAADVARACAEAGAPLEERRYRPHVTVAHRGRCADRLAGYAGPPWTVRSFDLVHSTLGHPVRHDVVRRFELGR